MMEIHNRKRKQTKMMTIKRLGCCEMRYICLFVCLFVCLFGKATAEFKLVGYPLSDTELWDRGNRGAKDPLFHIIVGCFFISCEYDVGLTWPTNRSSYPRFVSRCELQRQNDRRCQMPHDPHVSLQT